MCVGGCVPAEGHQGGCERLHREQPGAGLCGERVHLR